jgi:hypothetical protein
MCAPGGDALLDAQGLSDALESFSDRRLARKRSQHVRPLKGLRGTPLSEVARLGAVAWGEGVALPEDEEALHQLFCTAHEDGLLAVGLAAAAAPDAPWVGLDLADRWLDMVDDLETADALGWLLYGPSLLAAGRRLDEALPAHRAEAPIRRRAALIAALAALPVPIEGPSAAPLRARLGERRVAFVEAARSEEVGAVCEAYRQDEDPHVRKALGRVLRGWGECDPEAAEGWLSEAQRRGGVARQVREQLEKGARKGRRLAREAADDISSEDV